MPITRSKKEAVVKEIGAKLNRATTIGFVNYRGLSAGEATELRRLIREEGGGFSVVKKTLLSRALTTAPWLGERPALVGEVALAYWPGNEKVTADSLAVFRLLRRFGEETKHLQFLGGVFEGRFLAAPAVLELAQIPDRQTLYARLLGMLTAPVRQLAVVLGQIAARSGGK